MGLSSLRQTYTSGTGRCNTRPAKIPMGMLTSHSAPQSYTKAVRVSPPPRRMPTMHVTSMPSTSCRHASTPIMV